jgi:triosephosphate isomerase
MKPKMVIGNWKMNKSFEEADDLIIAIGEQIDGLRLETGVVLCPPFLYLELATDQAQEADFTVGAQNCSEFKNGAVTGEIYAEMLAQLGVEFCLVGHSERRKFFSESNQTLAKKVDMLLDSQLVSVLCCGEVLEERKANRHFEIVEKQIKESLFHLSSQDFESIVIAYEPVWAIGTGETATPQQAEEMHAFIRQLIEKKYGTEIAYTAYILYGGSCNAQNALELFSQPNVDGGLIGGASLKANDFVAIIEAAETVIKEN